MSQQNNLISFEETEYKMYARQLSLLNIQIEGQQRLKMSRVLCVGAGGLGATALLYLAASGVGLIGIIDDDTVNISNLQRQIIYEAKDVGKYKSLSATNHLKSLNNNIDIQYYVEKLTFQNANSIIKLYDIVIDCTDNFEARHILSYTCQILHKVHIYAAISTFLGQASVFNYMGGPHYHEVYTKTPKDDENSCLRDGVIGVLPGIMGTIQATEAIKIITGVGKVLSGYILRYDALEMSFKKVRISSERSIPVPSIMMDREKLQVNSQRQGLITFKDLKNYLISSKDKIYLVDIRTEKEYMIGHLKYAINIPLSKIRQSNTIEILKLQLRKKHIIIIYCSSEIRTKIASAILRNFSIKHWTVSKN